MKQLISAKAIAALALGVFAAASTAHARGDVQFSVGVQVPGIYVHPATVYVQPRSTYLPAPRHHGRFDEGRNYERQQWQSHSPYRDQDRDGIANIYDSGSSHHRWRQTRFYYGPYGDLDRDGIMNLHDRDRDGDGVRNRYDHLPDNPNRR